ncbi:MAG: glutathione S-transferase family protein [Alphaproteobacteria bacterium]
MLKVFHAPQSRSSRLIWLLEELSADYQIVHVNISRMDGTGGPDPRNPHPLKQVPAIEHEGAVITESAVIFDYLCGVHAFAGLKPLDAPGRARFASWIGLYVSTLEPVINAKFRSPDGCTPVQSDAYDTLCARLKGALEAGPYLLGEKFSALDILFGSLPMFFRTALPDDSIYDEWIARLERRPALVRARYKDAPPN